MGKWENGVYVFSSETTGADVEEERIRIRKHTGYSKKFNITLVTRRQEALPGGGYKLRYPRWAGRSIYTDCLVPPIQRWFPSQRKAFNLLGDFESDFLIEMFPRKLNPSLWYNSRRKCYALVFARAFAERAKFFLNKKFRYEPRKDVWVRRVYKRHRRKDASKKTEAKS